MPYSHSFAGVTPPARYSGGAWTRVLIEESADGSSFGQIDDQAIPLDASPESPDAVNITTETALLAAGYYRMRFTDADGVFSPYTPSVLSPGTSGGTYATVTELRARYPQPLSDDTAYPDEVVEAALLEAAEIIEDACDVAFIPRTVTTRLIGDGGSTAILPHSRLRSISAATVDGESLTGTDLTDLVVNAAGVYRPYGWTNRSVITVTYTHGYDAPPARVKSAVMLLAKTRLVTGPVDERATSLSTEDGTITLLTPGVRGSVTGIPEVDATIEQYREYVVTVL